ADEGGVKDVRVVDRGRALHLVEDPAPVCVRRCAQAAERLLHPAGPLRRGDALEGLGPRVGGVRGHGLIGRSDRPVVALEAGPAGGDRPHGARLEVFAELVFAGRRGAAGAPTGAGRARAVACAASASGPADLASTAAARRAARGAAGADCSGGGAARSGRVPTGAGRRPAAAVRAATAAIRTAARAAGATRLRRG